MLHLFHDNMKAWVNIDGKLSKPIPVDNDAKQGDIPAPRILAIYFSMLFTMAFKDRFHDM